MQSLDERAVLHGPGFVRRQLGDAIVLVDGATPNWIATDRRGAGILEGFDGRRTLGEVIAEYAHDGDLSTAAAAIHVRSVVGHAMRSGLLATAAFPDRSYAGRAQHLTLDRLDELWIHADNRCNFSCSHCLVSSGPGEPRGAPIELYRQALRDAIALGATRFFFTGGEPFVVPEIFRLVAQAAEAGDVVVLTNGSLLGRPDVVAGLAAVPRDRVRLQVSLDGATREGNDAIRGAGTFAQACAGIRTAAAAGCLSTVTATVTKQNLSDLVRLPELVASLGGTNLHLLWMHRRGRAIGAAEPSAEEVVACVSTVRSAARRAGVRLDNDDDMRARANALPGTRFDLSQAGWRSLAVYADGRVYPSAATAGEARLACGSLAEVNLETIWRSSPLLEKIRKASIALRRVPCGEMAFLCGGGDPDHAFLATGDWEGDDPWCAVRHHLLDEAIRSFVAVAKALRPERSGWDAPPVWHLMGEAAIAPGIDPAGISAHGNGAAPLPGGVRPHVSLTHSNCVLTIGSGAPRDAVRAYYARAAETPQPELCCPAGYDPEDLAFLPAEVAERSYGCGSPVGSADLRPGERVIDLGCGGGIDCFLAARRVGPTGSVLGIDMTDEMLAVARSAQAAIAGRLGYDVIEFRKGFLEQIPAADASADVVVSNCVVNLSADKRAVLAEIRRVLSEGGRTVIADIVSEAVVPPEMRANPRLWGECISGALTEQEFLARLEEAGFHGLSVRKRTSYREIDGYTFVSVTVHAYKRERSATCLYLGHRALYLGPGKSLIDEEGHEFSRGEWTVICADTAARLRCDPYRGSFLVADPARRPALLALAMSTSAACGPACC